MTEKRQQIGEKVREIQGSGQQVRVLDSRIRILEQKINQMQLRQTDKDTIERTAHNAIKVGNCIIMLALKVVGFVVTFLYKIKH